MSFGVNSTAPLRLARYNLGMRFRKLRIAWSAMCGVVCLLLVVLWMRSYSWRERIVLGIYGDRALQIGHVLGELRLVTFTQPGLSFWQPIDSPWGRSKLPLEEWRQGPWQKDVSGSPLGFGGRIGDTGWLLYLPYWFLVLTAAAVAAIPWVLWRFSLRTLLIATTLVAVVLGAVIYGAR